MPMMESAPVVVECVPLVRVQVEVMQEELDGDMEDSSVIVPTGSKNFKRFKKVLVRKCSWQGCVLMYGQRLFLPLMHNISTGIVS